MESRYGLVLGLAPPDYSSSILFYPLCFSTLHRFWPCFYIYCLTFPQVTTAKQLILMRKMLQKLFPVLILFFQCVCSSSLINAHLNAPRDQKFVVEKEYLKWVNHIGHKYHKQTWKSEKRKTKNKLKPCKTIKVRQNKKPKAKSSAGHGHFLSVQQAISSLPKTNCRLVISIGAGTYR